MFGLKVLRCCVFMCVCSFKDCFCIWVGNFISLDYFSKSNLTYFQTQQMPPRRALEEQMQQMMEAQAQLMQVMT
jgi:hypothetical protein